MHHLIFEGAELAGKSWIMSQVYNHLEPKYRTEKFILDGCLWFNCDNGIFGTKYSSNYIKNNIKVFQDLKDKNLILEKFHISDVVYHYLYNDKKLDYELEEKELERLNFKIIFIKFREDEGLIKKRIKDRLNLYPHYESILKDVSWYLKQQKEYEKEIKKSKLNYFEIETDVLPDYKIIDSILNFLEER